MKVIALLDQLANIGASRSGGYDRLAWTPADSECRNWFISQAESRGLDVEVDRNGNLWAWLQPTLPGTALVIGSHLDSVPRGGAYDGPLGIASAFAALDELSDFVPSRPVAIVAFVDEEGGRFGIACAGSRLMTGSMHRDSFLALTDLEGVSTAEAMRVAGQSPDHVGADTERVARIGEFIELHVEQGHLPTTAGVDGLTPDAPLGLATQIWPHGRWRVDLHGQQNHAGATKMADRHDPMLDLARVILGVNEMAIAHGILGTVGKVTVSPGAVNAIPGAISAWIDARGDDEATVKRAMAEFGHDAVLESWTPITPFDAAFADDVNAALGGSLPLLPSGAGHDAGVLALAGVPTAMILVRNPSGISHAPEEYAEDADCELGVVALAAAIRSRAA